MEHTLICPKTFRYFTFGNPNKAKYILYVLHGYGQLAEFFIRKFQDLGDDYFIVAPEGMHRFYLKGSSGRVGASWMTKEAREQDITDTLNWLTNLKEVINSKYNFKEEITLGFSQGGATAARWNEINNIRTTIYWASVFPSDIINQINKNNKIKNHFVIGKNDAYFDEFQQKETIQFYLENGFKIHQYEGNHSIDSKILEDILSEITQ